MYVTVDEIKKKLGVARYENLVANSDINQIITDSCGEIDGYLAGRYRLPIREVPENIRKYAKDIAVYNLVSDYGINEDNKADKDLIDRYERAIEYLEKVAEGKIELPLPAINGEGKPVSDSSVKYITSEKLDLSGY
jgi:phage gp36-like protein